MSVEPAELESWDFSLPQELVAAEPPPARDGGRLLVVGERLSDRLIPDFCDLLSPDDLVVFNDVKVRRARLRAHRVSGGRVEILILRSEGNVAKVLLRPARKVGVGDRLRVGSGTATVRARGDDGAAVVEFAPNLAVIEEEVGEMPLPPYMGRPAGARDVERYQTVYAQAGALAAAAAPTAGLHFTPAMLDTLDERGMQRVTVTLEVGLGTFRPLTPEMLASGQLHAERFHIPVSTWDAVESAHAAGRRMGAVGTTSVRAIESATGPGSGETKAFFRPGWQPRRVGALLTNFHLPRSSLLMLVAAFAGRERVFGAYQHAIQQRYRFYSYGDACFFPRPEAPSR